jgi:hypothetical protein
VLHGRWKSLEPGVGEKIQKPYPERKEQIKKKGIKSDKVKRELVPSKLDYDQRKV